MSGVVVDDETQQEVACLRLPGEGNVLPCFRALFLRCSDSVSTPYEHFDSADYLDLDPSRCLLYKTADRLYLSCRKASAKHMRQSYERIQEELGKMGETCDLPGSKVAVF